MTITPKTPASMVGSADLGRGLGLSAVSVLVVLGLVALIGGHGAGVD